MTLRLADATMRDVRRAAKAQGVNTTTWIRDAITLRLLARDLPERLAALEARVDLLERERPAP